MWVTPQGVSNFLQYSVSALVAPCVLLEKVLTKEKKMSKKNGVKSKILWDFKEFLSMWTGRCLCHTIVLWVSTVTRKKGPFESGVTQLEAVGHLGSRRRERCITHSLLCARTAICAVISSCLISSFCPPPSPLSLWLRAFQWRESCFVE